MNTYAELFLEIAREHFALLEKCEPPIRLGSTPADASDHFRHALICSTFSAFAVEHAVAELIWIRCWLQTPEPYRAVARRMAETVRSFPAKLELLSDVTRLDPDRLRSMKELSAYRNRLAHASTTPFAGEVLGFDALRAINEAGRGDELDTAIEKSLQGKEDALKQLGREFGEHHISLQLSGLGTDDVEQAEVSLRIAEEAVQALRAETDNPDWLPIS